MEPLLKILLGYAAKQYNITEDAVAELLFEKNSEDDTKLDKTKIKPDALTALLAKDTKRVTALKAAVDETAIFDKAFDKAKKEVLGKEEKRLAKAYGIEGDKFKLDTLVADIIKKEIATAEIPADKITIDVIKKHPAYLALESGKNEELETLKTTQATELKKLQDAQARGQTLGSVKAEVLTYFDDLKPVLSTTTTKAANQRTKFANIFDKYDYEKQEGSKELLILQNGKRLENAQGYPMTLKDLVAQEAGEIYDFAVQDEKGAPGNQGGAGGAVTVPKDRDAYDDAILGASTPEERTAITDAFVAAGGTVD